MKEQRRRVLYTRIIDMLGQKVIFSYYVFKKIQGEVVGITKDHLIIEDKNRKQYRVKFGNINFVNSHYYGFTKP